MLNDHFFYIQLPFAFAPQKGSYYAYLFFLLQLNFDIFLRLFLPFAFFFFQKTLLCFTYFFVFLCVFDNNFVNFIYSKKIVKNIYLCASKINFIFKINFWNNIYIEHESNGDSNKDLTLEEYLDKLKPHLRDILIDLQNSDTWKINLTIAISFISSKDVDEEHLMHAKRNKVELISYNVNDINDKLDKFAKSMKHQVY